MAFRKHMTGRPITFVYAWGAAVVLAVTTLLLLSLASVPAAAYQPPVWGGATQLTSNTADDDKPDLAVDDSGRNHIVFQEYDGSGYDIYYATDKSGAWETTRVTGPDSVDDTRPEITLDSNGKAHVVFNHYNGSNWDIGYANNVAGNWNVFSFSEAADQMDADIAAGTGSRVDIAYRDWDGGDFEIEHKYFNGSTWVATPVTSNAADDASPVLAVDSGGVAHVVYSEGGGSAYDLYYSRVTTGTVSTEALPSGVAWEGEPSIALDGSGPWVAFVRGQGDAAEVIFAAKTYGFWAEATITTNSVGDIEPSITLDASGTPSICYSETGAASSSVWVASNGSGAWVSEELTTTSTLNRQPALAGDSSGNLHLAFRGSDGDNEIYFRQGSPDRSAPTATLQQPSTYWRSGTSVTMTWTASDNQDLAKVEFYYAHLSSNTTWPATSSWTPAGTATAGGTSDTGTKTFTLGDGSGYYRYFARATDANGNRQALASTYQARVALDQTDPSVRGLPWNPIAFNPKKRSTKVRYVTTDNLADDLTVQIKIYNIYGKVVRTMNTSKHVTPGTELSTYTTWNGYSYYRKIVRKGRYRARVRVTDESGNFKYGGNLWVTVVY